MYYTSKTKDVDAIKSLLPKKKNSMVWFFVFSHHVESRRVLRLLGFLTKGTRQGGSDQLRQQEPHHRQGNIYENLSGTWRSWRRGDGDWRWRWSDGGLAELFFCLKMLEVVMEMTRATIERNIYTEIPEIKELSHWGFPSKGLWTPQRGLVNIFWTPMKSSKYAAFHLEPRTHNQLQQTASAKEAKEWNFPWWKPEKLPRKKLTDLKSIK